MNFYFKSLILNKTKILTLQKIDKTSKSTKLGNTNLKKYTKLFSHSIHCHYLKSPQQWQLCIHLKVELLLDWEDPLASLALEVRLPALLALEVGLLPEWKDPLAFLALEVGLLPHFAEAWGLPSGWVVSQWG